MSILYKNNVYDVCDCYAVGLWQPERVEYSWSGRNRSLNDDETVVEVEDMM